MKVILGCEILHQQGWSLPPILEYEYRMQPLTYLTIVAIKNLFPVFTCEQIYCLATAASGLTFLAGCVEFVRHITHGSRILSLVAAILLPEMYAITMYPNSSIFAAAFFIWALICLCHHRYVIAGILMCIAVLFRVDVVAAYPVIFPLFIHEGKSLKNSILLSAVYALLVTFVSLGFFWLLQAQVFSSLHGYSHWNNTITSSQVLMAVFGYYSLSYLILLPLGIYTIIRRKSWKELFLVLTPIIILHDVYRSMGCASKHYLYLSPFVIIAGVRALEWIVSIVRERRLLKWMSIVSVALFLTVSIRLVPSSRPWLKDGLVYNGALLVPICSTHTASAEVALGIGAGQCVPTLDEKMLASGQLFYPLYIHDIKKDIDSTYSKIKTDLEELSYCNVQAVEWGINNYFAYKHINDQYLISLEDGYYTLSKNGRTLNLLSLKAVENEDEARELLGRLRTLTSPQPMEEVFIIVDTPHIRMCFDQLAKEGLVDKTEKGLYLLKINPSL